MAISFNPFLNTNNTQVAGGPTGITTPKQATPVQYGAYGQPGQSTGIMPFGFGEITKTTKPAAPINFQGQKINSPLFNDTGLAFAGEKGVENLSVKNGNKMGFANTICIA